MKRFTVLALISLLLLSSAFAVLGSAGASVQGAEKLGAVDTTGLTIEYRFYNGGSGDNITDTTGNGYYGLLNNTNYQWHEDYLQLSSDNFINVTKSISEKGLTPPASGTVEVYAKIEQIDYSHDFDLWAWDIPGCHNGDARLFYDLDNTHNYSGYIQTSSEAEGIYSDYMPVLEWRLYTLVKDGTNLSIYVNGTLIDSTTVDEGLTLGNSSAIFKVLSVYNSVGDIKYFAFWTRALSSTEVQNRYTEIQNMIETVTYQVTVFTNTHNGTVTINGVAYQDGQTFTIESGTYTISAAPPDGYEFDHWETTGVTVADTESATTTITITSNGTVTAHFVQSGSGGGDNDDTSSDNGDTSGGGGVDNGNDTNFLTGTITIFGYEVPVWMLIVVVAVVLLVLRRR